MDFDTALKEIGEFGSYQKKVYFLLNTMSLFQCCQMLLLVFVSDKPTWQCSKNEQFTAGENYPCLQNGSKCRHVTFNGEFTSIATEWQLICDDDFKANFAQSVMMAGCLIGVFLSGPISDRFGRKWVIILSQVFGFSFGLATAFAQTYMQFLVARFLCGLTIMGAGLSLFVLLSEIIGSKYRGIALLIGQAFFSLGFGLLAYLANVFRDWRQLCIAASLPGLLFTLFSISQFDESPRWLFAKGKTEEMLSLLRKMANANGRTLLNHNYSENLNGMNSEHSKISHGLMSLFVYRSIRTKMIVLTIIWLVTSMVYYGLSFNMKNIEGNKYWNFFFSGLVEIPSCFIATPLVNRIGRKRSLFLSIIFASCSCLASGLGPTAFQTLSVMAGKFGISAAFSIAYLYSAELIPTIVRNSAMGYCSMTARIGGILAPVVVSLAVMDQKLPMVVFGVSGVIAAVSGFFLPETLNNPVSETLE